MSVYVGDGQQILLYHYNTDINWYVLNNTFQNLYSMGIIKCDNCLQVDDDSHFTVKAGLSAFIIPKNHLNEICKMETTVDFQITITDPANQQYLVLEYEHQDNPMHGVDFLLLDGASINPSYHIIVAQLIYDGSNNLTGFNYNSQTKCYGVHSHDQMYYTKTEADNRFVNISGDTMTGDLTIDRDGEVTLTLSSGNGTNYYSNKIILQHNNSNRILLELSNDSNKDFYIARYNDAGNFVNYAMIVHRQTNNIELPDSSLKIGGSYKSAGYFYTGTTTPTNANRLNYDGYFYATRVYNAIYNDIVDFIDYDGEDEIEYGKVYKRNQNGDIVLTDKFADDFLGIASDTYGFSMGVSSNKQIPIAIGGFVLAYVDWVYSSGTPLIARENGILTKWVEGIPEHKILAFFDRVETKQEWNNIKVNGRYWVRVR